MIQHKKHLLWVIAIALAMAGCDRKTAEEAKTGAAQAVSPIVAEVNGDVIRQNELDSLFGQRRQQAIMLRQQEPDRQTVLNEMVDAVLLVQYAKAAKVDQDPEVQAVLKRAQADILQQAVRHRLLRDKPITNEEIAARVRTMDTGTQVKPVKNDQFMAEQQLRARAYNALQGERVDGLMKDLRGQAKVVIK